MSRDATRYDDVAREKKSETKARRKEGRKTDRQKERKRERERILYRSSKRGSPANTRSVHVMKDSRKKRIPQEPYYVPLSSFLAKRISGRRKEEGEK